LGIFPPKTAISANWKRYNRLKINILYFHKSKLLHFLFTSWEFRFSGLPTFAEKYFEYGCYHNRIAGIQGIGNKNQFDRQIYSNLSAGRKKYGRRVGGQLRGLHISENQRAHLAAFAYKQNNQLFHTFWKIVLYHWGNQADAQRKAYPQYRRMSHGFNSQS
jgi:hypothetical protein